MKKIFKGKNIVVGITGSIAAYKACGIVSTLRKAGSAVDVVLTENAKKFVTALSLQYLSGGRVYEDMFIESSEGWSDKHIGLAEKASLVLVAPASADFIARAAQGRASDLLSALLLTVKSPVVLAPAMNSGMYTHPLTQRNIAVLKKIGYKIIKPQEGPLACGSEGIGRMAEAAEIIDFISKLLQSKA